MPSILVVDDQPDVLETSADLLRMLGYKVFSADSGEAALRVLRETRGIEVLLTDVVMPHMDGLTLTQHARSTAPEIKVILMSGYAVPDVHAAIREDDRIGFLLKPFNVPDLARVLRL
jgi:CheY-like chemotaxis protein